MDLNADLGEGFGRWTLTEDEALLACVTSANVACGFHAGDASVMRRVCDTAAERGCASGRRSPTATSPDSAAAPWTCRMAELTAEIAYQIGALRVFAEAAGSTVSYVKPHGALYNRVVRDEEQAAAVVAGVLLAGGRPAVLGLPGSRLLAHAEAAGLTAVEEAFADRAYTPQGTLVPRGEPGAVVHDADEVVRRSVGMALDGAVTGVDGSRIAVRARSLCVHGDTPGAAAIALRVRAALEEAGVRVSAFA